MKTIKKVLVKPINREIESLTAEVLALCTEFSSCNTLRCCRFSDTNDVENDNDILF